MGVVLHIVELLCRLQLAALHFNENTNRNQAATKQGTKRYDVVFPKYKKGGYVVKKILVNATYGKVCAFKHIATCNIFSQVTLKS